MDYFTAFSAETQAAFFNAEAEMIRFGERVAQLPHAEYLKNSIEENKTVMPSVHKNSKKALAARRRKTRPPFEPGCITLLITITLFQ